MVKSSLLILSFLLLSCNPSHIVQKPPNKKDIFSDCKLIKTESNYVVGLAHFDCKKKIIIATVIFSKDGSLAAMNTRRMVRQHYKNIKSMKLVFTSYVIGNDGKNYPFMLFSIDPT